MEAVTTASAVTPYEILVDARKGIVRVNVIGEITFLQTLQGRRTSARICREHGIRRVITDMRQGEWKLKLEDALSFGMTTLAEAFPSGVRFATLAREGDTLPETMVRALSLTGMQVRMVRNDEEAERYLLTS